MPGYITNLNENVEHIRVRYNKRYGNAIAADVYSAKALDKTQKYPALTVGTA